jgi:arylsulfatase A-like enzyme
MTRVLVVKRVFVVSAAIVGSLVLVACASDASRVEFVDLVGSRALETDGERLRARETVVADETWVAVELPPDRKVSSEIEVHHDPVLELAGALTCGDDSATPGRGVLRGWLKAGNGRAVSFDVGFDLAAGWSRSDVNLRKLTGTSVTLKIQAAVPEGCALMLSEATLRQTVDAPEKVEDPPQQVLLVSVDTLRRDAVGAFGGSANTPHLDWFSQEAEGWTQHYAAASWTKPSHASMLTGYLPQTHRAIQLNQGMDPAIPTLAERFRDAGYETGALVYDCTWLSPRWGFGEGFNSYRVTRWRAGRQAKAAAEWVLEHRDERFFFFFHTFEPHSDFSRLPYEAPGINQRTIAERFGVTGFGCRQGRCASDLIGALHRKEVPSEESDAEILRATYQAGVEYLDQSLGLFFEALRSSGVWDNLLIVITSDHGEEFADHGGFGHNTRHEEILRVPLLIKWPGGENAGVMNEGPTSSLDIAPTLLVSAGLEVDGLPGSHLWRRPLDAPVIAGTLEQAVVHAGFKGVFEPSKGARLLYDLEGDPTETKNLIGLDPQRAAVLEAILKEQNQKAIALHRLIGSQGSEREVVLSEREVERLRAFGYIR